MEDDRGLYYYPFPGNKRVRMYVREGVQDIEFRMWNQDDAQMWDEHGWVPYGAVLQAQSIYSGRGFDPRLAYDIRMAQALLREHAAPVQPFNQEK